MLDHIRTWTARARARREIECLDPGVLKDLGATRSGLRRIVGAPREVMRRLSAMAVRQRVDERRLTRDLQTLPALIDRCGGCRDTQACAAFLDNPSADAGQAEFCPNLGEFRRLSREDAWHA